jgi:hypothetical protein
MDTLSGIGFSELMAGLRADAESAKVADGIATGAVVAAKRAGLAPTALPTADAMLQETLK